MSGPLVLAVEDSAVSPGVLGFLVVAALGVATWLLIRSMIRQLRKIDLPEEQSGDAARRGSAVADGTREGGNSGGARGTAAPGNSEQPGGPEGSVPSPDRPADPA